MFVIEGEGYEKYLKLVDALCTLQFGWKTEEERIRLEVARNLVWQHEYKNRLKSELENKRKELENLK